MPSSTNPRIEKPCPLCGERILVAAKKCRHCGSWVSEQTPRQPAGSESAGLPDHNAASAPSGGDEAPANHSQSRTNDLAYAAGRAVGGAVANIRQSPLAAAGAVLVTITGLVAMFTLFYWLGSWGSAEVEKGKRLFHSARPSKFETNLLKDLAKEQESRYYFVARQGDRQAMCAQATLVAQAYLQLEDASRYQMWRGTKESDCSAAAEHP